jgi:class 3 adenylate cyclase
VAVHREAHGVIADDIIEVEAGMVQGMMGTAEEAPAWTPESGGKAPAESPFRTILFTDMEGSTATTQSIGDAGTMELLHTHDAIIRRALTAWGGREVKHMGDGIMGCFDSVTSGVECARAIQKGFASHNLANAEMPIRVRVGLSAGEPVEQHRDLFGAAVQMAARICRLAEPERILVSNVVRELAIGKQFVFEDRGETILRGFNEPVRLHEVKWD